MLLVVLSPDSLRSSGGLKIKKPCSDLINHILTKAEQPGRKVVFRPLTLYEDIYKDLMDMCIYYFILDAL